MLHLDSQKKNLVVISSSFWGDAFIIPFVVAPFWSFSLW